MFAYPCFICVHPWLLNQRKGIFAPTKDATWGLTDVARVIFRNFFPLSSSNLHTTVTTRSGESHAAMGGVPGGGWCVPGPFSEVFHVASAQLRLCGVGSGPVRHRRRHRGHVGANDENLINIDEYPAYIIDLTNPCGKTPQLLGNFKNCIEYLLNDWDLHYGLGDEFENAYNDVQVFSNDLIEINKLNLEWSKNTFRQ